MIPPDQRTDVAAVKQEARWKTVLVCACVLSLVYSISVSYDPTPSPQGQDQPKRVQTLQKKERRCFLRSEKCGEGGELNCVCMYHWQGHTDTIHLLKIKKEEEKRRRKRVKPPI